MSTFQRRLLLFPAALAIFLLAHLGREHRRSGAPAGETYQEECQSEGCDGEEVEEMHEDYVSECIDEKCDVEEVRELAGSRDAINAMLNDFRARGKTVDDRDFVGPCVPIPGDNNASGDNFFAPFCTQATINRNWHDFDFDHDDWDEGFGFDDPCNVNLPLGRTFNSLNLLAFFGTERPPSDTPSGGQWLPWFYAFSHEATDELDGRCGSGLASGGRAAAKSFSDIDYRVELYWPFFYGFNVPIRAGSIVHESRHQDDFEHDAGTNCARAASCDSSWSYNGANRLEVLYLWWLRARGTGVPTPLRDSAQTFANALLGNSFQTVPTNGEVFGPGTANPGTPLSIP